MYQLSSKHIQLYRIMFILLLTIAYPTAKLFSAATSDTYFKTAKERFSKSEYQEAITQYTTALSNEETLKHCPKQEIINANMSCGQAYWALREYEQGMIGFENRLHDAQHPPLKRPCDIRNMKPENLAGKTVLVYAEDYGIGDDITFMIGAKEIKDAGARVILYTKKGFLKPLLSRSTECFDEVTKKMPAEDTYDYDVYMLSLPWHRKNADGSQSPINIGSYIHPLDSRVRECDEKYTQAYGDSDICPIGICWQTSTNPVPGGRIVYRTIPLHLLATLAQIKNVALHSMQGGGHYPVTESTFQEEKATEKGKDLDKYDLLPEGYEVKQYGMPHNPQKPGVYVFDDSFDKRGSFEDTAAFMTVIHKRGGFTISCDTSTSCLAGALGVLTYMLLPFYSDSRWGQRPEGGVSTNNRFYKNVTEIWQETPGEWEPVINRLKEILQR